MTWGTWSYGDVVVRSETLKGARWIAFPTYVVHDEPDLLVTYLAAALRWTSRPGRSTAGSTRG